MKIENCPMILISVTAIVIVGFVVFYTANRSSNFRAPQIGSPQLDETTEPQLTNPFTQKPVSSNQPSYRHRQADSVSMDESNGKSPEVTDGQYEESPVRFDRESSELDGVGDESVFAEPEPESDEVFLQRFLEIKQSHEFQAEFDAATRDVFEEYVPAIEQMNTLKTEVITLQEILNDASDAERHDIQAELEVAQAQFATQEAKVMALGEHFMEAGEQVHLRYFTKKEIARGTDLLAKTGNLPTRDFRAWQASQE